MPVQIRGPRRTRLPLAQSRVELFTLFEGAIRHTTLWELMVEKNIDLPSETAADTEQPEEDATEKAKEKLKLETLISYMSDKPTSKKELDVKLDLCIKVLNDDFPNIRRVVYEISDTAKDNGVKYIEVSVDPYKFVTDHSPASVLELVKTITEAFKEAEVKYNVKAGILLQYQKGMQEESKEILKLCKDLKDENVVGIELAGYDFNIEAVVAEGEDPTAIDFLLFNPEDIAIFEEAKTLKIHRSVHAGEFGPSDVIFQALEKLGAERIVFGYSVTQVKIKIIFYSILMQFNFICEG